MLVQWHVTGVGIMLRMRDVDDVAVRIYRYVVAHSGCKEEGVAQALGISAVIAQDRLFRLKSAGLLVIGVAGDIRALPTGPDIVFEQLKAGVEFEYVQRKHPDLDVLTYGLTLWDLDREWPTGGFGGKPQLTFRDIGAGGRPADARGRLRARPGLRQACQA